MREPWNANSIEVRDLNCWATDFDVRRKLDFPSLHRPNQQHLQNIDELNQGKPG